MILVVDSSALALLINPGARPPHDPVTFELVTEARGRIEALVSSLTGADTLIIPTPVLAEVLVQAGDGAPAILEIIGGLGRVRVRGFDQRAAVETAMMTRDAIKAGDKRAGSQAPWQKVKVDRQIIAIARVNSATHIYSDDEGLLSFARRLDIPVLSTWTLPLPDRTIDLFASMGLAPDGQDMPDDDQSSGGI